MNTYNKGTHASYIYNLLGSGQGSRAWRPFLRLRTELEP